MSALGDNRKCDKYLCRRAFGITGDDSPAIAYPVPFTALRLQPVLRCIHLIARSLPQRFPLSANALQIIGMDGRKNRMVACHFFPGIAAELVAVEIDEFSIDQVIDVDGIRRIVDETAQSLLTCPQRLLRQFALGDILDCGKHPGRFAFLALYDSLRADMDGLPILANDPVLVSGQLCPTRRDAVCQPLGHALQIIGVTDLGIDSGVVDCLGPVVA